MGRLQVAAVVAVPVGEDSIMARIHRIRSSMERLWIGTAMVVASAVRTSTNSVENDGRTLNQITTRSTSS